MKKKNLLDVTFLILIRIDSIDRLENIILVTNFLLKYFNTHIAVCESARINNGVVKKLLKQNINYMFIEDKDPVLHKTAQINQLLHIVNTPFVSIWDADVICDPKAIVESVEKLRENKADVAWPYNGECYDTSFIFKELFLKNNNIKQLLRNKDKMSYLHDKPLVGGSIIMKLDKYIEAGKENEKYYGWGDDDFDRYQRFKIMKFNLFNSCSCLFHLSHIRSENSDFKNKLNREISKKLLLSTIDGV